jgi:hypothetical protein
MREGTIDYCKQIMINHTLIIILCLFLIIYIVINYSLISEGNIYGGNLPKTIIITGVIFLILYIFVIWEDNDNDNDNDNNNESIQHNDIEFIPKYKIINKINVINDTSELSQQAPDVKNLPQNLPQDLIIKNKYNNKYIKENSNNRQENSNIFISQKNKAKFGIKF